MKNLARKPAARSASKAAKTPGPSPIPTKAPGEFPMRINKYLAWKGISTRRDADDLIAKKQVTINGRFAVLGDKVEAADTILIRSNKKAESYIYYAYNKPRGIVTEDNRKGTPSIAQSIPLKGVFSVGSLDQNAQGLIILTNDRRIIDRLLNPSHPHLSEYFIRTHGTLRPNFQEKMEAGIKLPGSTDPITCSIKIMGDKSFTMHMNGGEKHIRQMCSLMFAEIETMERSAILNIRMGRLAPNSYRPIDGSELSEFMTSLGLAA